MYKTFKYARQLVADHFPIKPNPKIDVFMQRLFCIVFLSLGIATIAVANEYRHLKFERFNIQDASVSVRCLLQDHQGYIWFGTYNEGLFRYDGVQFKNYVSNIFEANSIKDNSVNHLFEDSKNRIWISTYFGLSIYQSEYEHFQTIIPLNKQGKPYSAPVVLNSFEDTDGRFWILMRNEVVLCEESEPFEFTFTSYQIPDLLSHSGFNLFNSINQGPDKRIWICTDLGLYYFDEAEDTFRIYQHSVLNDKILHHLKQISPNKMLLSCSQNICELTWTDMDNFPQIVQLSAGNTPSDHFSGGFSSASSWDIDIDHQGAVWVSSVKGVTVLTNVLNKDTETGEAIPYYHNPFDFESIANDEVLDLMVDREGTVWLGTRRGLCKYNRLTNRIQVFQPNQQIKYNLTGGIISDFCEANNRYIWIVSRDIGLTLFDRNSLKFYPVPSSLIPCPRLTSVQVDNNNVVWVGAYDNATGGLYKIMLPDDFYNSEPNFKKMHVTRYTYSDTLLPGTNMLYVKGLFLTRNQRLWMSTRFGGACELDVSASKSAKRPEIRQYIHNTADSNSIPLNNTSFVLEDSKGFVWIGTRGKGICRLNPKTQKIDRYPTKPVDIHWGYDNVSCIAEDKTYNIWIGTLESGLLKFDSNTKQFKRFTTTDGLPTNTVYAIEVDHENHLWITTSKGLVRLSPTSELFMKFATKAQYRTDQLLEKSSGHTSDGWLMFGGDFGFLGFYPDSLVVNDSNKPQILLTQLRVNQQEIVPDQNAQKSILKKSISKTQSIHLTSKQNNIQISFALLSFNAPQQNQYQYRLHRFEDDWHTVDGANAFAMYHSLPGGHYFFEVIGTSSDGKISSDTATLEITIAKAFYQTIAFKFGTVLLIILLLIGYYYYRLLAINRHRDELKRQVSERTAEIQNINTYLKLQAAELQENNVQLEERQQQIHEQTDELYKQKEVLEKQQAELQLINETKDRLFSIIAHDIKSPFSSVLGFSELLAKQYDEFDDESRRTNIKLLYETSKSVGNLLDNLLHWTRAQKGSMHLYKVRTDLHDIVQDIFELFQTQAKNKGNQLVNYLPSPMFVIADMDMMHTVFRNLVSNAIKYTDKGIIQISIDRVESNFIFLSVCDTGTGISDDVMKKMFQPTVHFSNYGTNGEKGTGLGLLICKEFIEAHGGSIEVRNRVGRGACFSVSIPSEQV